jgi:malate dehydrogenase
MERGDLLKQNGEIFVNVGKAIADHSKRSVKVIVVGNPCNTNALICAANAKGIAQENFSAMTRLDENRGKAQLAAKYNATVNDIKSFYIWGNHSSTMYPDINTTTIKGKAAK